MDKIQNPELLKNADINLPKHGDDSSLKNQISNTGGQQGKNTGEGLTNTIVSHNENINIDKLGNAGMLFGNEAQMYNSSNPNYITQRNDAIASALYNAGTTSKEDIANYLYQQQGFQNSSEEDRMNTVESVYNRLGQIKSPESQEQNIGQVGVKPNIDDYLPKSGSVYGKAGPARDGEFKQSNLKGTAEYQKAMAAYQEDVKRFEKAQVLATMSVQDIANSIITGAIEPGDPSLQYLAGSNPELLKQVQIATKSIQTLASINAISSGKKEENISISSIGDSNAERMAFYQKRVEDIQNNIVNIEEELRSVVNPGTPEFIIQSYIGNRTKSQMKQYQQNMSAYNMYKALVDKEEAEEQRKIDVRMKDLQMAKMEWEMGVNATRRIREQEDREQKGEMLPNGLEDISKFINLNNGNINNRTNNPGNILATGNNTYGAIGYYQNPASAHKYLVFSTPEEGMQAMEKLVRNNYIGMTMQEARNRWVTGSKTGQTVDVSTFGLNPNEILSESNLQQWIEAKIKGEGKWTGGVANILYKAGGSGSTYYPEELSSVLEKGIMNLNSTQLKSVLSLGYSQGELLEYQNAFDSKKGMEVSTSLQTVNRLLNELKVENKRNAPFSFDKMMPWNQNKYKLDQLKGILTQERMAQLRAQGIGARSFDSDRELQVLQGSLSALNVWMTDKQRNN